MNAITQNEADPFLDTVIGKLTVIRRERRGRRWAYTCRCSCGAITLPRRREYILRKGPFAACKDCSIGMPRSESGRPEPPLQRPRYLPSGHAIWRERARMLADAIAEPVPMAQVIVLARRFGWSGDLTREVLAAADGRELVKLQGLWQRSAVLRMAK